MNRKWILIAAGILNLFLGVILLAASVYFIVDRPTYYRSIVFLILTGVFTIVGSAYVLRKKNWELALAVSFVAFFALMLCFWFIAIKFRPAWLALALLGMTTIALTSLSRKDFERKQMLKFNVSKTWMPKTAGFLQFAVATFNLAIILSYFHFHQPYIDAGGILDFKDMMIYPGPLYLAIIFMLIGGIYALEKKHWDLALLGSFAAFFSLPFCSFLIDWRTDFEQVILLPVVLVGIVAIIFIASSKEEFSDNSY